MWRSQLTKGRQMSQLFTTGWLHVIAGFPLHRENRECRGKSGNSRQGKPREFLNFGKTHGKNREFENFNIESRNKESMYRKNYCVTSMILFLRFKILSFYYKYTQGRLKLHTEITGKTREFCFLRWVGTLFCCISILDCMKWQNRCCNPVWVPLTVHPGPSSYDGIQKTSKSVQNLWRKHWSH